eukprot:TRINITY_DN1652_c0_g1_i10.p1 TRINITY_DN1652_c0_g1~~TRINITY_DN1652_c0_g1_i10.p1  ORF type:complete len:682 (+),score=160.95 TRINITY_DN1652_c0_g1_i10:72-2048(+)
MLSRRLGLFAIRHRAAIFYSVLVALGLLAVVAMRGWSAPAKHDAPRGVPVLSTTARRSASQRPIRVYTEPKDGSKVLRTVEKGTLWQWAREGLVSPRTSDGPVGWLEVPGGKGWLRLKEMSWPPVDPPSGDAAKAAAVAEAFRSSWAAYRKSAWGRDELLPLKDGGHDWLVEGRSSGLTIIDGLTTALIMKESAIVDDAVEWLRSADAPKPPWGGSGNGVNVFEATIRIVGGMLSAFELRGEQPQDQWMVSRAQDLANGLVRAYNTTTGVPVGFVDLGSGRAWAQTAGSGPRKPTDGAAIIAEAGGQALELRTLTLHTGDAAFDRRATWAGDVLTGRCPAPGSVCPTFYHPDWDAWVSQGRTLGAGADSYYEYLLKQHLLERPRGHPSSYWTQFLTTARAVKKWLVRPLGVDGSLWLGFSGGPTQDGGLGEADEEQEHLSCFAAGWYALGATESSDTVTWWNLLSIAQGLTQSCRLMYSGMKCGVGPERAAFSQCTRCPDSDRVGAVHANYALRPEYVESLFYLWRATGDEKYRRWGWEAFVSMNTSCRTPGGGYAQLNDVNQDPGSQDADLPMPSYWMAETLLYLWLLFSPSSALPLDEWVLNTEGHPLRRRGQWDASNAWPAEAAAERQRQQSVPIGKRIDEYKRRRAGSLPFEPV